MVFPETTPLSFNKHRFLYVPLKILDIGFNNDIPKRAKPIIFYLDEIKRLGIYLPRLVWGQALSEITKDKFYWFDQSKGGDNPGRAEIKDTSGKISLKIPYLIRNGQDVVAVARLINMSGLYQRLSKCIIQFVDGITSDCQNDIESLFEILNCDKLSLWKTHIIREEKIPLDRITCTYNMNWG